jgi:delta14-sterol reductase
MLIDERRGAMMGQTLMLSTMDITTDGFGFMLAIGDLAWVPFTYGLQLRYLAFHPVSLSPLGVMAIAALEGTGYYIFRASNWEKDSFKSGRNPRSECGRVGRV